MKILILISFLASSAMTCSLFGQENDVLKEIKKVTNADPKHPDVLFVLKEAFLVENKSVNCDNLLDSTITFNTSNQFSIFNQSGGPLLQAVLKDMDDTVNGRHEFKCLLKLTLKPDPFTTGQLKSFGLYGTASLAPGHVIKIRSIGQYGSRSSPKYEDEILSSSDGREVKTLEPHSLVLPTRKEKVTCGHPIDVYLHFSFKIAYASDDEEGTTVNIISAESDQEIGHVDASMEQTECIDGGV